MTSANNELSFVVDNDGKGILILGEEADFPMEQSDNRIEFGNVTSRAAIHATELLGTIAGRYADSGRYLKLDKESAKWLERVKGTGPITGVIRKGDLGAAGNPGEIIKHLRFEKATFKPGMAAGVAGLMTQIALEAALAEIKNYLVSIDEKVDLLLRQRKDEELAKLRGTQHAIKEADEIYRRSGTVSDTTWSKISHLGGGLNEIAAFALERIEDTVHQIQGKKVKVKQVSTQLDNLNKELPAWLGILATSVYLHDSLYVLELARVRDHEPSHLDSHREGITQARTKRLSDIAQRLYLFKQTTRAAGDLDVGRRVKAPRKAPQVQQNANRALHLIEELEGYLELENATVDRLDQQSWPDSFWELTGNILDTGQSSVEKVQRGIGTATEKMSNKKAKPDPSMPSKTEGKRKKSKQKAATHPTAQESKPGKDQASAKKPKGPLFRQDKRKAE